MSIAPRAGSSSPFRGSAGGEAAGGIALAMAAMAALVVANSPLGPGYAATLHRGLGGLSLLHWINDGLMAVFFLLVGLELKRELHEGQLSTWDRRFLPVAAAAAGMAVPAAIYVILNRNAPVALRGWAIPTATDIAFALGVLAILGSRVPVALKVLLTAIAVIDDLGAIVIIAGFYTDTLWIPPLLGALALIGVLAVLGRIGVAALWPYLLLGAGVWWGVLLSGIHATLAGVAVAATVPIGARGGRRGDPPAPLHRLEHALKPWIAFLVLPVFAFANAGIAFGPMRWSDALAPVPVAVAAGLFLGKQAGVFGACWALIGTGRVAMPEHTTWPQLYGMAVLCGIGFTMSLFIGALAFGDGAALTETAKIGVLAGSLGSAVLGHALLRRAAPGC